MTSVSGCAVSRFFILAFCLTACLVVAQSVQAQGTYTVVHSFAGKPTDGAFANGELAQDTAGNFYGTTQQGGADNLGTVFKLEPGGVVTTVYAFGSGNAGANPEGGLLLDTDGNLFGTTTSGGPGGGVGTVFRLEPNGTVKSLHTFSINDDAGPPSSRLVTNNGYLYGITSTGGSSSCGCGTIFRMTKGGTETIVYNFTGGADGAYPQGLIRDSAGNLYGLAQSNISTEGAGTVWTLDASGAFSVLYTFSGGTDGGSPVGRLIRDANGNIHGATASGGDPTCNCGVVFRLDATGHESVVHKFFGRGGGARPFVGLLDAGGALYGTTGFGGDLTCNPPNGCGVLYKIGKTGQYTILHRFSGMASGDGAYNLIGGLTLGTDGSIYGSTWYGGDGTGCSGPVPGCGTIFKLIP